MYIFKSKQEIKTGCHCWVKVPTTMDAFMLYGPVVKDGYGVCYNPHPDYMVVCVASFRSWPNTDSRAFADALVDSLRQIRDLCTGPQWKTSSVEAFWHFMLIRGNGRFGIEWWRGTQLAANGRPGIMMLSLTIILSRVVWFSNEWSYSVFIDNMFSVFYLWTPVQ